MYIRRTREDAGIILPPQSETIHELELTPETYPLQSKIMDMLAKHAQIEVDEGRAVTMMSILALITRQRQAAVWPGGIYLTHTDPLSGIKTREHIGAMYKESIKLDKAVELAEEFVTENGERVAMMSQFAEPITEVVNRLNAKGIRAVAYYGDTPRDVRDRIQTNFDRDQLRRSGEAPEWDVVVCHYTLASEGLNLTAATQTIILDEQWNPGKAEQAYARTQRIGQTEETGIHILRIKKSIDTWMASLIEEKRKIVTGFETEVTFQDLAKLFTDPPKDENGNGS
jgi:SNF2 family DNA or RNA helicase